MLTITIPDCEVWDEKKQEFYVIKGRTLQLEHSLVSLSKWESKWKKPFYSKEKTTEEMKDYIRCMTITQNVDPIIYNFLTTKNVQDIKDYIADPMTATTISNPKKSKSKEPVMTAEIIYFYMTAFNIPFECQKWHLNRLLMLIRVCSIKNAQPEKMNKKDYLDHRRALNKQRLAARKNKHR